MDHGPSALFINHNATWPLYIFSSKLYKIRARPFLSPALRSSRLKFETLYHPSTAKFSHAGLLKEKIGIYYYYYYRCSPRHSDQIRKEATIVN